MQYFSRPHSALTIRGAANDSLDNPSNYCCQSRTNYNALSNWLRKRTSFSK